MKTLSINTLKKRENLPYILFGAFFLLVQCFVIPYEGDDTYFLTVVKESSSLFSFVEMRFMTWTGRLTSEFLIGLFSLCNLWVWRLINTVIATYFVWLLGCILKLTYRGTPNSTFIHSFVCLSFFIIPISVTTRACSWFTGSFYYLWPTVCLLLAIMPYIKKLYNSPLTKTDYILAFIGTLYASFMEQTGAVLLCFSLLSLLYFYIKKLKLDKVAFFQVGLTSFCLLVCSLSPGNALRVTAETATWYPTFDQLSLVHKLIQGINWTHTHFVREQSFMLLALSLMLFSLVLPKLTKLWTKVICFLPSLYLIGMLLPFNQITARATSFEYGYDVEGILNKLFFNPIEGILPSLIGVAILLEIGILLYFALEKQADRYLCCIFYLATLASGYILGLSPTIFASGPRIFFLSDILLLLISGIALLQCHKRVKSNKLVWRLAIIIYSSVGAMMAVMYIGGIVMKSIFKIS